MDSAYARCCTRTRNGDTIDAWSNCHGTYDEAARPPTHREIARLVEVSRTSGLFATSGTIPGDRMQVAHGGQGQLESVTEWP